MTTETIGAFYARRAQIQASGTQEEREALAGVQALIQQMPDLLAVFGEMPLDQSIIKELAPDPKWPEGLTIEEAREIAAFEAAAEIAAMQESQGEKFVEQVAVNFVPIWGTLHQVILTYQGRHMSRDLTCHPLLPSVSDLLKEWAGRAAQVQGRSFGEWFEEMGFGGDSGGDFRLWYKQKCALLDDLQQLFGADFEGAFQALTRYDEA